MNTSEETFKKHFNVFRSGLHRASMDHYLDTGTLSGSMLLSARECLEEYTSEKDKEIERLESIIHDIIRFTKSLAYMDGSKTQNEFTEDEILIKFKATYEHNYLTTQVVEAERKGWNEAIKSVLMVMGINGYHANDTPSKLLQRKVDEIQRLKK